jgi:hypothetical protein
MTPISATKQKPPGGLGQGARKHSDKSTSTIAQLIRLVELISIRPRHTHELRQLGISHPAGRIDDLEKQGFSFETARITTIDSDGYPHRGVALYTLINSPSANHVTTSE